MFEIGQKLTKQNYVQGAIWCNQNNAHIETRGDEFIIVANVPVMAGAREQLLSLESKSGLTRAVREVVLAEKSGASDYVRAQAEALETLARELRHE